MVEVEGLKSCERPQVSLLTLRFAGIVATGIKACREVADPMDRCFREETVREFA